MPERGNGGIWQLGPVSVLFRPSVGLMWEPELPLLVRDGLFVFAWEGAVEEGVVGAGDLDSFEHFFPARPSIPPSTCSTSMEVEQCGCTLRATRRWAVVQVPT
jgi:hypothetical protein